MRACVSIPSFPFPADGNNVCRCSVSAAEQFACRTAMQESGILPITHAHTCRGKRVQCALCIHHKPSTRSWDIPSPERPTWSLDMAAQAFKNSFSRGSIQRQALSLEVAPCQDNFTHLIFMRNGTLRCRGDGRSQWLIVSMGLFTRQAVVYASNRDSQFLILQMPTCEFHTLPSSSVFCWVLNYASMVFCQPFTFKLEFWYCHVEEWFISDLEQPNVITFSWRFICWNPFEKKF